MIAELIAIYLYAAGAHMTWGELDEEDKDVLTAIICLAWPFTYLMFLFEKFRGNV